MIVRSVEIKRKVLSGMTKEEKLIVSAYTGILMVDFDELHKFIEKRLGRPVFTHELADELVCKEIEKAVKEDFLKLCEETEQAGAYEAEWQYWSGWSGNHDKRIEDATCSKCGYMHPTIRFGSPDLLQDYCPSCKSRMKKR